MEDKAKDDRLVQTKQAWIEDLQSNGVTAQ